MDHQRVNFKPKQPAHIKKRSEISSSSSKYIKFKHSQGKVELIPRPQVFSPQFSYRKVYVPSCLQTNICQSSAQSNSVYLLSLSKYYQPSYRPQFFGYQNYYQSLTFKSYDQNLPICLYQMDHLSHVHFRSFFITQGWAQDGMYDFVVNRNGRLEVVRVNDIVLVNKNTAEHVWGITQPWKIMIIKLWATLNGGYHKLLDYCKPFSFIQHFTTSNWKYYNLQREKTKFIEKFQDKMNISYIILQSKNSNQLIKTGLAPNSNAFNIVDFDSYKQFTSQYGKTIQIKSRFKHKWSGKLSPANTNNMVKIPYLSSKDKTFRLEKNILMTQAEFFNLFCSAYITSNAKNTQNITQYLEIKFQKNYKKAIYFKLTFKQQGYFDFSFIQSQINKQQPKSQISRLDIAKYNKQTGKNRPDSKCRYLKCKILLTKCLQGQSLILKKPQLIFPSSSFQMYNCNLLLGHNHGQSSFIQITPGTYYLRLKSQPSLTPSTYYLNYTSKQPINVTQQQLTSQEKIFILQQSMLSMIGNARKYLLGGFKVFVGDWFLVMGYGGMLFYNQNKDSQKYIQIQVDLRQLEDEGFQIKQKIIKQTALNGKVLIKVLPNQYFVLIIKRIHDIYQYDVKYHWPPKAINIFKAKDLKQNLQ